MYLFDDKISQCFVVLVVAAQHNLGMRFLFEKYSTNKQARRTGSGLKSRTRAITKKTVERYQTLLSRERVLVAAYLLAEAS